MLTDDAALESRVYVSPLCNFTSMCLNPNFPPTDILGVGGKLGYYEVYKTEWSSFVLLDETSLPITCSLLISVSESQSGRPNLYSVEIRRAADSVKAPEFHVHVISGTYLMKLVHITEASGRFRLFLKKSQYTPVVWVKLLTRFGVKGLVVEKVTESEIADAIEINAE